VTRIASLALLVLVFSLAGCLEGVSSPAGGRMRTDTPEGMIVYLEAQRLPVLKSVEPWENDYGPGLKLTTAHYEIYTTLLEPLMLSQVPGFVESAYRGYQAQLPQPVQTTSKFTVYLFATRQQWEDFTVVFTGHNAPMYLKLKAGAYYLNGACVAYNIGRERTFASLGHEGWHQFNSRHFAFRLPSWLDEGIAMMFETSIYDRGLFIFSPGRNGYRLGALRKTLVSDKTVPLRELIALNPGQVVSDSDEAVSAFYSQAYALVRFLREDDYGKRLFNYQRLLGDGLNGQWPLNATGRRIAADRNIPMTARWNSEMASLLFKHYVGEDIDQIEKQYLAFCKRIVYHIRLAK